jgi:hypothetical protein
MQRVTCLVRLDGDPLNTVQKSGVSPAEIVILNDIHGGGDTAAVTNIQPNEMDKVTHSSERSRLRGIYGHHVVDRLFPGEFSRLPVTLKEIASPADGEIEGDESEEEETQEVAADPEDPEAARRAADAQRKRDARAAAKTAKDEGGSEGE